MHLHLASTPAPVRRSPWQHAPAHMLHLQMQSPASTVFTSTLCSVFLLTYCWYFSASCSSFSLKCLPGGRGRQCSARNPFMCAEDWLRDYRVCGGGSFITKGNRPSAKFRNFLQQTNFLASKQERQLKRWTQ
eukprot:6490309-Amphidinium_carterae.1